MRAIRALSGLLLVVLMWATASFGAAAQDCRAVPPDDKAFVWAANNYDEILDLALPVDVPWVPGLIVWRAHARGKEYGPHPEFVFHFTNPMGVTRAGGKTLKPEVMNIEIIAPEGCGIMPQAESIRHERPTASPAEVARLIKMQRWSTDVVHCPELKKLAREFEHLKMTAYPNDELVMHADRYDFAFQSLSGKIVASFFPARENATRYGGLVRWAKRVRDVVVNQCRPTVEQIAPAPPPPE